MRPPPVGGPPAARPPRRPHHRRVVSGALCRPARGAPPGPSRTSSPLPSFVPFALRLPEWTARSVKCTAAALLLLGGVAFFAIQHQQPTAARPSARPAAAARDGAPDGGGGAAERGRAAVAAELARPRLRAAHRRRRAVPPRRRGVSRADGRARLLAGARAVIPAAEEFGEPASDARRRTRLRRPPPLRRCTTRSRPA